LAAPFKYQQYYAFGYYYSGAYPKVCVYFIDYNSVEHVKNNHIHKYPNGGMNGFDYA
jgi:hypothetical protein